MLAVRLATPPYGLFSGYVPEWYCPVTAELYSTSPLLAQWLGNGWFWPGNSPWAGQQTIRGRACIAREQSRCDLVFTVAPRGSRTVKRSCSLRGREDSEAAGPF